MLIVVLDPARQARQDRACLGRRVHRRVGALERVHERFGRAVGLRTLDRRGQRHKAQFLRERTSVPSDVWGAVVREPLDCRRGSVIPN